MKQWVLNLGVSIFAFVVITLGISALFGTTASTTLLIIGKIAVYIILTFGIKFALLVLAGYFVKTRLMSILDDQFEED